MSKLLDETRALIRTRHLSIRTEETYINWIRRCVLSHGRRHPQELSNAHVNRPARTFAQALDDLPLNALIGQQVHAAFCGFGKFWAA